jgi:uncharacterized repeat protein (TIGR01451 family)
MTPKKLFTALLRCFPVLCLFILNIPAFAVESGPLPAGFQVFPTNNIWNVPVDSAPLHPNSAQWMDVINGGAGHPLHPAFGYMYLSHLNGFPYNIVGNSTPLVKVTFAAGAYVSESDPLPAAGLPMPADVTAEGDPPPVDLAGDRHLILVDVDNKVLHEMFQATRQADGSWTCMGYSRWDLTSNALRPDTWTSADAAGLPIFPLLIRWDEIQSGEIKHALRFTLALTYKPHLWPARHDAVSGGVLNPPMGMRVRLKANFDISGYSATNQIILKALKKYGMFMADNGADWDICGAPNANFDDNDLHNLTQIIPNTAFEVVDTSAWMVDPNSGQVGGTAPPPTPTLVLQKSVSPTTTRSGDTVTFTIQYQNTASANANTVVVNDVIPTGSTLVSGSITGGGTLSGNTISWNLGTVSGGASGTVSFQAKVN